MAGENGENEDGKDDEAFIQELMGGVDDLMDIDDVGDGGKKRTRNESNEPSGTGGKIQLAGFDNFFG